LSNTTILSKSEFLTMHTTVGEITKRQSVILFADDDQICLDVGARMLQKLGYTVLEAKDGQEAIEVYKANQSKVDLVILDMKMPNNGGLTFDQLRKINAHLKILITSGYTEDYRIRELMGQGCDGFIQKPFSLMVLSEKVRKALDN
jgi:two-component system cell cycle sensor histidine kinase/response regulator CckA